MVMDQTLGCAGPILTNIENDTSLKGFDEITTTESSASSVDQENENIKNDRFLDINSDEMNGEKNLTENLDTNNGNWNNLLSTNGGLTYEANARPLISVRKTEELLGMANEADGGAGVEDGFSAEGSAIAVNRDPVQSIAENFGAQPALPQFNGVLRSLGSEVVAYPVNPVTKSFSQTAEDPEPKQRGVDVKLPANIKLPDSITVIKKAPPQPIKKSITDLLANRGVTVSSVRPQSRKNNPVVSISTPLQKAKYSQSKVPTVDLTRESDNPRRLANRLNRRWRGKYVCQICDKQFAWQEELSRHMNCHRASRLECKECTAQYPTEADLQKHKQQYHGPPPDLAIPIVDLQQGGVLDKLRRVGVRSVIPLAQLHGDSNGGGSFGLPLVAVVGASNPAVCDIGHLGASNILPLGPLRTIAFNSTR